MNIDRCESASIGLTCTPEASLPADCPALFVHQSSYEASAISQILNLCPHWNPTWVERWRLCIFLQHNKQTFLKSPPMMFLSVCSASSLGSSSGERATPLRLVVALLRCAKIAINVLFQILRRLVNVDLTISTSKPKVSAVDVPVTTPSSHVFCGRKTKIT